MRITFVAPGLGVGGAEVHLIQYANGLAARGHTVSIVITGKHAELTNRLDNSVEVAALNDRVRNPRTWFRVAKAIRVTRPDVVVGWALWGNCLAVATRPLASRMRTVVVELNYLPHQLRSVGLAVRMLVLTLVGTLYKHANVVAANSDEILDWLRGHVGAGPRFSRVLNPIDIDRVERLSHDSISDSEVQRWVGVRLLAVGRLVLAHKGFDLLVEACALLPSHLEWSLIIVGAGRDREELESRIVASRMSSKIILVGGRENPFSYFGKADIVVTPSRFEGFPNVLLEAMSLGKATVSANCMSGPHELAEGGRTGILVPVDDARALSEALGELISNPHLRQRYGILAKESVRKRYSESRVFSSLVESLE